MVKLILATDMAKHKELLEELQKYVPKFDITNRDHLESVRFFFMPSFIIVPPGNIPSILSGSIY